jgi:hypothetical protein
VADKNLVGDIESANNSLSKMERLLEKLSQTAGKFTTTLSRGLGPVGNGGFGNRGYGVGSPNVMNQSFGSFGFMPPTGNAGATFQWANRMNMGISAAQGGLRAAGGAVVGGFMAMPDVAMTTARSTAFYGANLIQGMGAGGRTRIANATFGAMKGGISEPGYDAATAAILSNMGVSMTTTGVNKNQFSTLARSTANAAKYLNIDNVSAAQALGGLTQGSTSSALMRNFGIYTTNPITGERLSPTQIFAQLNQRMTGGQKLTREQLMTSMQGGALAQNLQLSGLDATQQQLAYQYMLDAASGKNMDLSDDKLMARLQKEAGINPMQSQYSANTSQAATMNAASDAYIEGMKEATKYIGQFNKAMQGFLKSEPGKAMARLNAGVDLAQRDPSIAGGIAGASMALGGAGQLIGAVAGGAYLSRLLTKQGIIGKGGGAGVQIGGKTYKPGQKLPKGYKWGGKGGTRVVDAKGRFVSANALAKGGAGALSKGLGKAVPILGTALTGFSLYNNIMEGDMRGIAGDVGGILGGLGAAAGLTAATGGVGIIGSTAAYAGGSFAGSMAGQGLYDFFTGSGGNGGPNLIGTGSNTATGGATANFKLIHPVGKANIVCRYGQYDELHPNGHWAVDWAATEGTPIMAAADGTVTFTGGNARNTMGTSNNSYGLHIKVDHGNGYTTLYAHVSGFDASVGQQVKQGQPIARVGNTGFSQAPHLHFELWKGGQRIDPSPFLGANYADSSGGAGYSSASSGSASNGMMGSGDAGLLGFSSGAAGNGLKVPSSYKGAAIGQTGMGGGISNAATGRNQKVLGQASTSTNVGGSIGTTGSGDGPGPRGGNNVVINLTIGQASDSEARRFAKLVKEYIDSDTLTSNMGRF